MSWIRRIIVEIDAPSRRNPWLGSGLIAGTVSPFILLYWNRARPLLPRFVPDPEGIEHAVEVVAASLYEAAVLALASFRRCGFADATFGAATRLTVRVKGPEQQHTVSVGKLQSWLNDGAKSPSEQVEKERLRALL